MTISPSSMTTRTRTNSRRTNKAPQAHNRRKKCRLRVGIFILRGAPEGQSPQARLPTLPKSEILRLKKQVQGRCACTCSVARAFSTNPNASANTAPPFAVPRLLLQPIPKSEISFFQKKCLHPRIASDIVLTRFSKKPRGCGGIGRRVRFRSVWGQPHEGSSPFTRTT